MRRKESILMKRRTTILILLAGLATSGCAADPTDTSAPTSATSALTADDVDYAEECTGILTYAENASSNELHSYLPINVVNALITRRAQGPFHRIAEISAVPGIAQARLAQIGQRANQLDYTDVGCLGVYEELAVSYDDAAAIVGYVNAASEAALASVVRFDPDQTVGTADRTPAIHHAARGRRYLRHRSINAAIAAQRRDRWPARSPDRPGQQRAPRRDDHVELRLVHRAVRGARPAGAPRVLRCG
jgi:hypothetical protein